MSTILLLLVFVISSGAPTVDGFGLREKVKIDDGGAINGLPAYTDLDELQAKLRKLNPPYNRHRGHQIRNVTEVNLCYCNEGHICDRPETCIKEAHAACFHAETAVYNEKMLQMETWHIYGCAPLESGSNSSQLTCNGHRSHHSQPFSIACCYEGNLCNKHLEVPPYANVRYPHADIDSGEFGGVFSWTLVASIIGVMISMCSCLIGAYFLNKRYRPTVTAKSEAMDKSTLVTDDLEKEEMQSLIDLDISSGSGSGAATLNQRTIAMMLEIGDIVGKGRYGEVRKATYRGSKVAVKTFYTTEEESWRNEREIYQTQMLNHENILQFVAADISSVDSMTQMLLITDFHECGSLFDYLHRDTAITLEEGLSLAYTTICGLEHLHNPVYGTGNHCKPQIAHRDIKSKNVIVKRKGVCCIADFGLAVRYENELIPRSVKIQVGTKRYMSPEVLCQTLNMENFDAFKLSDIYAYAMLLWEILVGVDVSLTFTQLSKSRGTLATIPDSQSHHNPDSVNDEERRASEQQHAQQLHQLQSNVNQNSSNSTNTSNGSSGHGTSIVSRCTSQTISTSECSLPKIYERRIPFENDVKPDPTFDEMIDVVCTKKVRPYVLPMWTNGSNEIVTSFYVLMKECWNEFPNSRHSSLKIKMTLADLLEKEQKMKVRGELRREDFEDRSNDSGYKGSATRSRSPPV